MSLSDTNNAMIQTTTMTPILGILSVILDILYNSLGLHVKICDMNSITEDQCVGIIIQLTLFSKRVVPLIVSKICKK